MQRSYVIPIGLLVVFCVLTISQNAFGQAFKQQIPRAEAEDRLQSAGELTQIHVTDKLNQLPEAQAALASFHLEKRSLASSSSQLNANPVSYQVGQVETFRVLDNVATSSPDWVEKQFELRIEGDIANIWVEVGELEKNHVSDDQLTTLDNALLQSTPQGSINPANGIISNNNAYFGMPPNVDGDGKVDILLFDIVDGDNSDASFIGGYVTSSDLSPRGNGNNKDVLYLDTNPGITQVPIDRLLSTAAHEYQHLIHYNYDLQEFTFVNEGLSEWAELLNGYDARSMSYLSAANSYNQGLLSWDEGGDILDDYQRAGMFTAYLAERIGPAEASLITQNNAVGAAGYTGALEAEGYTLPEIVLDFHTANFLNDKQVGDRFGYADSRLSGINAAPARSIDGRQDSEQPARLLLVEPGATQYLEFKNVQDFRFAMDTSDPFATIRNRVTLRAILEPTSGPITITDMAFPIEQHTFSGNYRRIILQPTHVMPSLTSRVSISYNANWTRPIEGNLVSEQYDDGSIFNSLFFSLSSGIDGAVATRFEVPSHGFATLQEVSIAPYYLNQFSGSDLPDTAPRDVTLKIWSVALNGEPGSEIFSLVVQDPRSYASATTALNPFSIDLTPYQSEMERLPAQVFIGYGEAGTDQNYMVVGPSTYAAEDRSYIVRGNGAWAPLWETQFQSSGDNEFPLEGSVIPVRAAFLVGSEPVSNEEEALVRQTPVLEQSYPNPFSEKTTIRFSVPKASPVRLTVFDALGREVAVLVDNTLGAGTHEAILDGQNLPSGVYMYALVTEETQLTRTVLLVK